MKFSPRTMWRLPPYQPEVQSSEVVGHQSAQISPTSQVLRSALRRPLVIWKQQLCCQAKVSVPRMVGGTGSSYSGSISGEHRASQSILSIYIYIYIWQWFGGSMAAAPESFRG